MGYIGSTPTAVPLSGADILDDSIESADIKAGTIVNSDINASAAIVTSKVSGAVTAIASHGLATSATTDTTNAANISSGTIPEARIATLDATKLTGTVNNARISLDAAEIPSISTDKLTSGTIPDARLPSTALNSNVDLTTLSASNLTSGTLPDARFGALPAVSGANLTSLNGSNIGSGTVPTARLGSGTASSSTFLRGDSTYATAGGPDYGPHYIQHTRQPLKGWVHYNQNGGHSILDDFNISTLADNGTGDTSVNFTDNMANVWYAIAGSCNQRGFVAIQTDPLAVGSFRVTTRYGDGTSLSDFDQVCILIGGQNTF